MDNETGRRRIPWLLPLGILLVLVGGFLAIKLRVFSKYSYYSGPNWQMGLEKEICKWSDKKGDTGGVTLVNFDWGHYVVMIHEPFPQEARDKEWHGYLTFRPVPDDGYRQKDWGNRYPAYLVDPMGRVWRCATSGQIPVSADAADFMKTSGTRSQSKEAQAPEAPMTIQGSGGLILKHFKQNPNAWKQFGTLSQKDGESILIKE